MVENGFLVHSNIVASQVEIHQRYGGVVPEIASRQHILAVVPTIQRALNEAEVVWDDIEAIAVTRGPGLVGSLLVGVNTAKAIAWSRGLPLIGINHIEAHIYANWLTTTLESYREPWFPLLCLVVSGGHTELILMEDHGRYVRLGRTLDDAAGEAFDKAARVLGLPYPGGPSIQAAANEAEGREVRVPRAELKGTHDFSFSGVKTAMLRLVRDEGNTDIPALANGFQESVADILVRKTVEAARDSGAREVVIAGGVAANRRLRELAQERLGELVRFPEFQYCTDNAAMIGGAAYFGLRRGLRDNLELDVEPGLDLTDAVQLMQL